MNTYTPIAGTPAQDHQTHSTTTQGANGTPAMSNVLLAYEKHWLIQEVSHRLDTISHLFSVSQNYPIDADEQSALIGLAWEKLECAQQKLNTLATLITDDYAHSASNVKDNTTNNASHKTSNGGNP